MINRSFFLPIRRCCLFLLPAHLLLITLAACHHQNHDELRVGIVAGPETALMEVAKQVAKKRFALEIKIIEFNDWVSPNYALADGSIDANIFQNQPYLAAVLKDHPLNLVAVGKTFLYPLGAYSQRFHHLTDIPNGASIALPNDPANQARALLLLASTKRIQVKNPRDPTTSLLDVIKNPHHYHFHEIDAAQLPRSLADVDLAFINYTYAQPAGLKIEQALLAESANSLYINLIVTRAANKNNPKIKELVQSYQSMAVLARAKQFFGDHPVTGWLINKPKTQ